MTGRDAVVARCRLVAQEAARKLNLDCAADIAEIPVRFDDKARRDGRIRGYFCYVADDGLGEITINTKRIADARTMEAVLLHEFGHALVHYLRGADDQEDCHGKTFQYVMLTMGQGPGKSSTGPSSRAPETVYTTRGGTDVR